MAYTDNRPIILANREKYLPFIYPLLMPIFALIASGVHITSFQAVVKHCVWVGFLDTVLIVLFQRILYLQNYKQVTKWVITSILGSMVVLLFLLLEYNVFNFALLHTTNDEYLFSLILRFGRYIWCKFKQT